MKRLRRPGRSPKSKDTADTRVILALFFALNSVILALFLRLTDRLPAPSADHPGQGCYRVKIRVPPDEHEAVRSLNVFAAIIIDSPSQKIRRAEARSVSPIANPLHAPVTEAVAA